MPFTHVALCLLLFGLLLSSDVLWSLGACATAGCLTSFTAAPLMDDTVYVRMREKNGWSVATFYAGHVVLHVLPTAYVWFTARTMAPWSGVASAAIHVFWWCVVDFERCYVSLPLIYQRSGMCVAVATELCTEMIGGYRSVRLGTS